MRELRVNFNVPEMDHHEFEYVDGKKIPKEDSGIRFAYIDRRGRLHVTKWEDDASEYGDGVYMAVDDVKGLHGLPEIGGRTYKVWGAGSNWVRISAETREKFYTAVKDGARKVVAHPNSSHKTEAYETLRQIYTAIEKKLEEIEEAECAE